MERKNAWKKYGKEDLKTVFDFSEAYRQFISCCKTERECVKEAVRLAKERGYRDLQDGHCPLHRFFRSRFGSWAV